MKNNSIAVNKTPTQDHALQDRVHPSWPIGYWQHIDLHGPSMDLGDLPPMCSNNTDPDKGTEHLRC